METLNVPTTSRIEFVDITNLIRDIVSGNGWSDGILTIYCPHTTAAITINEAADPDVRSDILKTLSKLIPHRDNYAHMEGNSDAHIKASVVGPSQQVIIENGQLLLGTWQGIFFCEFDGPRTRKVFVQFVACDSGA
ncbi:MAG: secondary thiamine-phosphate synthase enzyme YjbQ [bacterium]|nr:secondary thiamine-phosphate synthase enzyme YjbQ [bacterium]